MILFIFSIYCLIGTAQYIIVVNKFREKWQLIKPLYIPPKPIIVQFATIVKFLAISCFAIPVWPLWCGITDDHISKRLTEARKKIIEDDQIQNK